MSTRVSRRGFLGKTLFGGASLAVLPHSRTAWSYQANEKVNVALVGVGGRGRWFVGAMPRLSDSLSPEQIAAAALYERVEFGGLTLDAALADCGFPPQPTP